ncbi:hypothetical protein GRI44_02025 [Altererythrobacter confluentis]|uniref:SH3 domain-containing protein n=1 Tax=Allopontixanthobacter confluentis TaxID=1849021 RepID=A0A6L7GFT7_9SPHN|nr:hypothetical protein [Allopontixanthobacter confluentis]MXP13531.1 hypothetical protein [Allopontixanthobacter confluentis]
MRHSIGAVLLLLTLAGCNREDAPAEKLKDAAENLVDQVDGSTTAQLPDGLYAPRNECTTIAGAEAFRKKLASVVKARDVDGLAALAATDIKLDFGGGSGVAELRKRLADTDWTLWDELDTLLNLGCAANDQGGITLPWYFDQKIDKIDPMMGMIVMGQNVPLRDGPGQNSTAVRMLSWDGVELAAGLQPGKPYQNVKLADGSLGYVETGKLRSLIAYRLTATSRDGKWSIISLVAGD